MGVESCRRHKRQGIKEAIRDREAQVVRDVRGGTLRQRVHVVLGRHSFRQPRNQDGGRQGKSSLVPNNGANARHIREPGLRIVVELLISGMQMGGTTASRRPPPVDSNREKL
jgi:hypothetical protein